MNPSTSSGCNLPPFDKLRTQRALAHLQRQATLPLPGPELAATLTAAMLLEIYLLAPGAPPICGPSPHKRRGAATGGGTGERQPLAPPPFDARTAARVRPSGEGAFRQAQDAARRSQEGD